MNQTFIEDVVVKTKELMGIPPCFIDRGDPGTADFDHTDFIEDNAWHDLDLSGIVPSNAVAVLFTMSIKNTTGGVSVLIRKKGNVNTKNMFAQTLQVVNIPLANDGICPIGPDGLLEYLFIPLGFWITAFAVKGWWL